MGELAGATTKPAIRVLEAQNGIDDPSNPSYKQPILITLYEQLIWLTFVYSEDPKQLREGSNCVLSSKLTKVD